MNMNLLKTKSFWISLIVLVIILFIYGYYNAPVTVTTCIPPENGGNCTNNWGTTPGYRASTGLLAIGIGILPTILVSLLISYFLNRK